MTELLFQKPVKQKRKKESLTEWAFAVYKLDKQCMRCGINSGQAHHIIRRSKGDSLRTKVENGIVLCPNCHEKLHRLHKGLYATEMLRIMRQHKNTIRWRFDWAEQEMMRIQRIYDKTE